MTTKRKAVNESWTRLADQIERAAHRRYERMLKKFACPDRRVEWGLFSVTRQVAESLRVGDAKGAIRAAVEAEDIARERLFADALWEIGVAAGCVRRLDSSGLPVHYQPIGFI